MKQFLSWLDLTASFYLFRRKTMADLAALSAKIDEVKQHADAVVTRVQTQVTALQGVVAELQAQLAAVPGAPDLQPQIDALSAIETELDAVAAS